MQIIRFLAVFFLIPCSFVLLRAQDRVTLSDLVDEMHDRYEVKFAYDAKLMLSPDQRYALTQNSDSDLKSFLDFAFANGEITYLIRDEHKVLIRKTEDFDQGKTMVSGTIIDGATGEPLPYASIYCISNFKGVATDAEGNFSFGVDPFDTIAIQYLGFKEKRILGRDLGGKIQMDQSSNLIDEITIYIHPKIYDARDPEKLDLNAFQLLNWKPGGILSNDILSAIQMQAGIDAANDQGGELIIRGSQPDEVLFLVDGIPLYKVDHYYGIFGAINGRHFSEMTLYKNSLPVYYDSRTAGLLMLNSEKEVDKVEGIFDADILQVGGHLKVPVSDKLSFIASGRLNHTDPLQSSLGNQSQNIDLDNALVDTESLRRQKILNTVPEFEFSDYNAKAQYQIGHDGFIQFSAVGITDDYQRIYADSFVTKNKNFAFQTQESFSETEYRENQGFSLNGSIPIFNHHLEFNLYQTTFNSSSNLGIKLATRNRVREKVRLEYDRSFINELMTSGAELNLRKKDQYSIGFNYLDRSNTLIVEEVRNKNQDLDQNLSEVSAFAEYIFKIGDLRIQPGIRGNYVPSLERTTLSPSVLASYQLQEGIMLKSSYARLYQNIRELTYESRLGTNIDLFTLANVEAFPQGLATNMMAGFVLSKNNFTLDVEFYQKELDGAINFLPVNPGLSDISLGPSTSSIYQTYQGRTFGRGMDLSLLYDGRRVFSQLAYTYSKIEDQFEEISRGNPYPNENDRRHQAKFVGGIKLAGFQFSSNFVYATGKPYTSFDLLEANRNRKDIDIKSVTARLPDYIRVDLNMSYDLTYRGRSLILKAGVFNLTDRSNVKYIQQTFRLPRNNSGVVLGFESPLIQRLINFGVTLKI